MIVEPANRIERCSRSQVFPGTKHRIVVPAGHHQQRLYSTHGTAHETGAIGIDVGAGGKETVSAGDIRQIVGEIPGPAGCSPGKAAAAPLIDFERCDARSIERGGAPLAELSRFRFASLRNVARIVPMRGSASL